MNMVGQGRASVSPYSKTSEYQMYREFIMGRDTAAPLDITVEVWEERITCSGAVILVNSILQKSNLPLL